MDRKDRVPPRDLGQRPEQLDMMPGQPEDIENASARANREAQHDTTALRPEDAASRREPQDRERGG